MFLRNSKCNDGRLSKSCSYVVLNAFKVDKSYNKCDRIWTKIWKIPIPDLGEIGNT